MFGFSEENAEIADWLAEQGGLEAPLWSKELSNGKRRRCWRFVRNEAGHSSCVRTIRSPSVSLADGGIGCLPMVFVDRLLECIICPLSGTLLLPTQGLYLIVLSATRICHGRLPYRRSVYRNATATENQFGSMRQKLLLSDDRRRVSSLT
jgi:hypothetical protein